MQKYDTLVKVLKVRLLNQDKHGSGQEQNPECLH